MSELQPGLPERLARVSGEIARAEARAGRTPGSVRLLAVGKTFDAQALLVAANAGVRAFGENYAQEGCGKVDWFREHHPELELE